MYHTQILSNYTIILDISQRVFFSSFKITPLTQDCVKVLYSYGMQNNKSGFEDKTTTKGSGDQQGLILLVENLIQPQ